MSTSPNNPNNPYSKLFQQISKKICAEETVFVVGGGSSLSAFDWLPLRDKNVIGCNDAYLIGDEIVDICIFGDKTWWEIHKDNPKFRHFSGQKVCCAWISNSQDDRIFSEELMDNGVETIERIPLGIGTENKVAWNWSTGAAAINLAILLGAQKVVLLGFDMKVGKEGNNNWYPNIILSSPPAFDRFKKGFEALAEGLKVLKEQGEWPFTKVEILNAGPDSALDIFPKVKLEDVLNA